MGDGDARAVASGVVFVLGATSALAQTEPLQPGDTLQISVLQDPKLDRQVVIAPDGMISFPLAGHIKAAGITPQSLENLLRARLQKNYTERLDITVSLAAVNPTEAADSRPRVYISGEVLKPGPYPPSHPSPSRRPLRSPGVKSLCGEPANSGSSQDRRKR